MDRATGRHTLVILAAGVGSRFGGDKQVEAVGPSGETIIDYSIYDALRAGFTKVAFVVREELELVFRDRFDPILSGRCAVAYVQQKLADLPDGFSVPPGRTRPWGTGQAVLTARDVVDGPFAVINADDFYGRSAYASLAEFFASPAVEEIAVIGYPLGSTLTDYGTVSRGICRLTADGYLDSIVERKRVARHDSGIAFTEDGESWHAIGDGALASMNMWGLPSGFCEELDRLFVEFLRTEPDLDSEFYVPVAVGNLLAEGRRRVRVLRSQDPWHGVTYREDLPRTREGIARLVESGVYPTPLWGRE